MKRIILFLRCFTIATKLGRPVQLYLLKAQNIAMDCLPCERAHSAPLRRLMQVATHRRSGQDLSRSVKILASPTMCRMKMASPAARSTSHEGTRKGFFRVAALGLARRWNIFFPCLNYAGHDVGLHRCSSSSTSGSRCQPDRIEPLQGTGRSSFCFVIGGGGSIKVSPEKYCMLCSLHSTPLPHERLTTQEVFMLLLR